jgi:hypothetical protein
VPATTANGKGNFSFEGPLPYPCVPDDCSGTLTAGDHEESVPLAFPPAEPPVQPEDELVLETAREDAHGGDAVRTVGFVLHEGAPTVVSGGADGALKLWAYPPEPTN